MGQNHFSPAHAYVFPCLQASFHQVCEMGAGHLIPFAPCLQMEVGNCPLCPRLRRLFVPFDLEQPNSAG